MKTVMVDHPSTTAQQALNLGRPRTHGRMFALNQEEVQASHAVVVGTSSTDLILAYALVNPRANLSFVSWLFTCKHTLTIVLLSHGLFVVTRLNHDASR